MSKRATVVFLIAISGIGIAQLCIALAAPSRPGPWLGALAMALLSVAPIKRLKEPRNDRHRTD